MTGLTWRRHTALAAAAPVAALALSACGGTDTPSSAPTTTAGSGQLGGAASATPTTPGTAATTPPPTSGGDGGNNAPTYPTKPGDYAVAFMKAWSVKDYNRVAQLGTQAMVQQAKDSNNGNGAP